MSTYVKICGITRPDDAVAAARCGADAIGLVFTARSPRAVDVARAREIAAAVPAGVLKVGLFLDPSADQVEAVLACVPLDLLQFHGRETAAFCRGFGRRYIKTIGLGNLDTADPVMNAYPDATALLFDSHAHGAPGGTGRTFDWRRLPAVTLPIVLAGGLTPANVAAAVRAARPYAVDVSSGVESAPGIKDAAMMASFINEVRRADETRA